MVKTDFLIIGTGIAGLSFAIKTARKRPDLSIVIMTKASAESSNTRAAQGGVASVTDTRDSFEAHIQDTLRAGGGFCDAAIVEMVVKQAPLRISELMSDGIRFDQSNNRPHLGLEGGHSHHRILHRADHTGLEIETQLLRTAMDLPNISLLEHHFAVDLSIDTHADLRQCTGVFYFDELRQLRHLRARITVLSTGGSGQMFAHTTNATVATGDGVAMAFRAKAKIADMDWVQFHPTALDQPDKNPRFLLSEALRGFGAYVVNQRGKRFLFKHDPRAELATRDIVSKAILSELSEFGNRVYLDCRHLDPLALKKQFPTITEYCISAGMNPSEVLLPIIPVAHYQCGGIAVDRHGQTSVNALFAIGECARTGMHGNNRLASNSLLEALVFAHQASEKAVGIIDNLNISKTVYVNTKGRSFRKKPSDLIKAKQLKTRLQTLMSKFYRDEDTAMALVELELMRGVCEEQIREAPLSSQWVETLNLMDVAGLMITHAASRPQRTIASEL